MRTSGHCFDQNYIAGAFVPVTGEERVDIVNPATEAVVGQARLASRDDARRAVEAAMRAQPAFARTTVAERVTLLERLEASMLAHAGEILEATITEYGGPVARAASPKHCEA